MLSRGRGRTAAAAIEAIVLHLQVVTAIVLLWEGIVIVTNVNATVENAIKTGLRSNGGESLKLTL